MTAHDDMKGCKRNLLARAAAVALIAACAWVAPAGADEARIKVNIPAQPLESALKAFGVDTNSQVLFAKSVVAGLKTTGLKGDYTPSEALRLLLAGTNLRVDQSAENVFLIKTASAAAPPNSPSQNGGSASTPSESQSGDVPGTLPKEEQKGAQTSGRIERVVVTAQKRAQAAQSVPIALSVQKGAQLESAGATSIEDLPRLMPGLQIVSLAGPGTYSAAARGVTNLVSSPESTAVIGLYLDESPISSFGASLPDVALFDIARVEFLRGPQGTLFGEGSQAGTLRIISNRPDPNVFEGRGETSYGGVKDGGTFWSARGLANLPLVQGQLGLRVAGQYNREDGWIDVPDLQLRDANDVERYGGRVALGWTPSENLTVDISWLHQSLDADTTAIQTQRGVNQPSALGPLLLGVSAGPVRALSPYDYDYDLGNVTVQWQMGFADLVSSSSYFKQTGFRFSDLSPAVPFQTLGVFGVPLPGRAQQTSDDGAKLFTQEVRLVSPGDQRFDWTVGVFYRDLVRDTDQTLGLTLIDFPVPGINTPIVATEAIQEAKNTAYAVFAEGTYDLTDSLAATLGARYYSDDRTTTTTTPPGAPSKVNAGDNAWSPNFILSWKPSSSTMLFARAARGFRSGGVNGAAAFSPTIPPGYGPESLWSYEVGAKTNPTPWLLLNAYAFYNDWSEIQLPGVSGFFGLTFNGGQARSKGFELETLAALAEGLSAGGNLTITDSEITQTALDPLGVPRAIKGASIPFSPDWSLSAFLDYRRTFSNNWVGFLRLDYLHRDTTFSDATNTPALENEALDLVGLRLGAEIGSVQLVLFSDNLLNDDASANRTQLFGLINLETPVRPRTIGVNARVTF